MGLFLFCIYIHLYYSLDSNIKVVSYSICLQIDIVDLLEIEFLKDYEYKINLNHLHFCFLEQIEKKILNKQFRDNLIWLTFKENIKLF